ncbi:hypothetical protein PQR05_24555 [Paraburkholderia sediminicola]|uniref:Uncharacterized protein n=1 Tax=Paraburkholderia metrosideri TaxID=580937 RepID=A0ABW9DPG6_9BURK
MTGSAAATTGGAGGAAISDTLIDLVDAPCSLVNSMGTALAVR